jgi:hypothetical protein
LAMSRRETREGWKDVVLGLTERQEELVEQREPQMTCQNDMAGESWD